MINFIPFHTFPVMYEAHASIAPDTSEVIGVYHTKEQAETELMNTLSIMQAELPSDASQSTRASLDGRFLVFSKIVEVLNL